MNFPESSDITPAKTEALRSRIERLNISLADIDEQFIRGSGHGGQKINKTSNAVQLRYAKLALVIKCQRERKRSLNRFLALREMVDRIEMIISPETSARLRETDKIRRKKANSCRRARLKSRPGEADI